MDERASFGLWLKERRKAHHFTQEDLAERISCSSAMVRKIESGERAASQQMACLLAETLGVVDGERAAFVRYAQGRLDADAARRELWQTLHTVQAHPTNLAAPLTALIGREPELERLHKLLLLDSARLVTLTGPPGIGKTRLSLEVGIELLDRFEDGVYFVGLASVADPELVAATIVHALGLPENSTELPADKLQRSLSSKQMLLLLDNFEQVLDASPFVLELLGACPHLKILITSREALHVNGEQQFPVPALATADPASLPPVQTLESVPSLALFSERARAVKQDFILTKQNATAVAAVCARLDGLPLAIELAAARIKMLSPQEMHTRLERRLTMLTGGPRNLPARQRTLRAAIDWSYNLLNEEEQTLFARLGVFVGGCTLEAANAICNVEAASSFEVKEGIESLLDKNLLKREEELEGESRFTRLETLREYAIERLELSGDVSTIRERHVEHYLALVLAAELQIKGKTQEECMLKLDREADNIRAALSWAVASGKLEAAARIVLALDSYWYMRGKVSEERRWLEAIADDANMGKLPVMLQAELFNSLGYMLDAQSDYERASYYLEKSLAILRQGGTEVLLSDVLHRLGVLEGFRGNYARAKNLLGEALDLCRETRGPREVGVLSHCLALIALFTGDYHEAESLETEAVRLLREVDDRWTTGLALGILGIALSRSGQLDRSEIAFQEALKTLEGPGANSLSHGVVLMGLAEVTRERGDCQLAKTIYGDALKILRRTGHFPSIAFALVGLASLTQAEGEAEKSASLFAALEGAGERVKAISVVPSNKPEYERGMAAARASLTDERWSWAWARGGAMTIEEAVAYALEESAGK
jgi:predicted ATPase/DNA-binding XRE family transcriptional regulator